MSEKILTEDDINYTEVRDYIVFLIAKIGGENGLSRKGIHKTCYVVKKNLGETIDVNNQLPFYWYYFGPFSNVIEQAISLAMEEDIIEEKIIEDKFKLLILKDLSNYKEPKIKNLNQIISVISELKINPFEIEKLTEFIYKNDAPRIFRYNFYKTIQLLNFQNDFLNRAKINQDAIFDMGKKHIFEWLYRSEATLPKDELFKNYLNLFSYYVAIIRRFIEQKKKFNTELLDHLKDLVKLSDEVWETFGEGERILSHDKFLPYEKSIPKWEKFYLSHLESLSKNLKTYDNHFISIIGFNNLRRIYTTEEKQFLRTVLP